MNHKISKKVTFEESKIHPIKKFKSDRRESKRF